MDAQTVLEEAKRGFRRLFVSDFQKEHATEAERAVLARAPAPVVNPLVQDYAAWRRSLLWIAGVALVLLALFEFATFQSREDAIREQAAKGIAQAEQSLAEARQRGEWQQAQHGAGPGPGAGHDRQPRPDAGEGEPRDHRRDPHLPDRADPRGGHPRAGRRRPVVGRRRSIRLARIGFLIMFLTPFVLAALPVKEMLDFGHLPEAARRPRSAMLIGFDMGMVFFLLSGRGRSRSSPA